MFEKLKNMFSLEKWIENFEGYLEAKIELIKFDIKEQIAIAITKTIAYTGLFFFGLIAFLFLNIGIGQLINHLMKNSFAGFLILGTFYLVVAFVFHLMSSNKSLNEKIEEKVRMAMDQPKKDTENGTNN